MEETTNSAKKQQFIRYIITGTVGTLFQYGIYYVLLNLMDARIAYSIATVFYILITFLMTNYYTFRVKPTWSNSLGYLIQQGLNYLMQISFLSLFLHIGITKQLAPIPVYLIALPLNFFILRFIFKKKIR